MSKDVAFVTKAYPALDAIPAKCNLPFLQWGQFGIL